MMEVSKEKYISRGIALESLIYGRWVCIADRA